MEKVLAKTITPIKWFLVACLATLGWLTFSLGLTSADMIGSEYGALAVILFEVALAFFLLAIVMAVDLVARMSKKDKVYLQGKRLAFALGAAGFLSTIPFAIWFNLADSPLLVLYTLLASGLPVVVFNCVESKSIRKPLIDS